MMQQIVVLSGPDMCGKTQIANELSRRTGIPCFKASTEHQSFLNEQNKFLLQLRYADPRALDIITQTGCSIIMDRGWPCEFAYSRFFNRDTDLEQLRRIDDGYAALGALVVFCYRTSYDGLVDDLSSRLGPSALASIDKSYRDFLRWTSCRTKLLNVDDEDLDREVGELLDAMHEQQS
jgi:hypothetical protein